MTSVYITIDTEYSVALAARLGFRSREEVYARSISCETADGAVGIVHQMEVMDRYGVKGVFFVDPMPALVWGTAAVAAVVEPILARGHEVQLHCHTEWLALAGNANPLPGREGQHLHQFTLDEQRVLLAYAREELMAAGAPEPTAFRAGNYGADDATLQALAELGIAYDSSHVPGIPDSDCRIGLGPRDTRVVRRHGVLEVPVGAFAAAGGPRHAQVTAVSGGEMAEGIRFAARNDRAAFVIVSHSFELLSRDRRKVNPIVRNRFDALCRTIAETSGATGATFRSRPPQEGDSTGVADMPSSALRTGLRHAEQLAGNLLYGRG